MDSLNLEQQYQAYLTRVGLNESTMVEAQKVETKRAFFAGLASMFVIMTNDVTKLTDIEALSALSEISDNLTVYWANESASKN